MRKMITIFSLTLGLLLFNVSPVLAQPVNDDCGGAISLTVNADETCTTVTPGTVVDATASPEDPAACGGTENDDVWFSFVATAADHDIDLLNVAGSTTDMYHSLWEGTCPGLTHQGLCSDANASNATGLTVGATYYLRVNTWSATAGATSTFDVCVTTPPPPPPPPTNDDCANAIDLGVPGATCTQMTYSTEQATDSGVHPLCDDVGTNLDIWFSFTAPAIGAIINNFTGTDGTVEAAVWNACGGVPGDEIYCDGNFADGDEVTGLTPGNTYFLQIWNDDFTSGEFDFCLTAPTCTAPTAANPSVDATNCPGTIDICFDVTMGTATTITVTNDAGATNPPAITADGNYCVTGVTPGTAISITLAHDAGSPCDADLVLGPLTEVCPPANDACLAPAAIGCGAVEVPGTTAGATDDNPAACGGAGDGNNGGVWYAFAGTGNEITVTVNADPGGANDLGDSQVAIYSGSCAALTCVGGNDDSTPPGGNGSQVVFDAPVGTDFFIYVDGFGTNEGEFLISLACGAPLPIELTSFEGEAMKEGNKITWSTASESNTEYHNIQRSVNGRDNWSNIGTLAAKGFSTEQTDYEFMDDAPIAKAYYRLKTLDFNRAEQVSKVVLLERAGTGFGIASAFPNPTNSTVLVQYHSPTNGDVELTISDITGKVVGIQQLKANNGLNDLEVNLTNLASGTYFLTLSNEVNRVIERIVKQ